MRSHIENIYSFREPCKCFLLKQDNASTAKLFKVKEAWRYTNNLAKSDPLTLAINRDSWPFITEASKKNHFSDLGYRSPSETGLVEGIHLTNYSSI